MKDFFYRHLLKKNYSRFREPAVLKSYARQIVQKLDGLDVDVVFSRDTLLISYLKTDKPLVFWLENNITLGTIEQKYDKLKENLLSTGRL